MVINLPEEELLEYQERAYYSQFGG